MDQQAIAAEFWKVGRLTLEPWLVPRLTPEVVTSHPGCTVVEVAAGDRGVTLTLSDDDRAHRRPGGASPRATGPTSHGCPTSPASCDRVSVTDGFPDLSEGFETSLPGLYMTGFASTRDFGPFYGFTKGCPSSARIAVGEMLR